MPPTSSPSPTPTSSAFAATHWTVVLQAARWQSSADSSPAAANAMAELCRTYWYPLYAYVRRTGQSAADAEDLTQEFFSRLLSRQFLADIDPQKGKFRSFLLAALKHFLANEWDRAKTAKRGGGHPLLSLDWQSAEQRFSREPAHQFTAEKSFDRHWTLALLDRVLDSMRCEMASSGKARQFEQLKDALTGSIPPGGYAQIAVRLQTTEGAVKVLAHRLRRRYRDLLRQEIARTVASPEQIEEEIQSLFSALGD